MRETIELRVIIRHSDLYKSGFKTVPSIYPTNHPDTLPTIKPMMYAAEAMMVNQTLAGSRVDPKDITMLGYVTGLTQPFGYTMMPQTDTDQYVVIIRATREAVGRRFFNPKGNPNSTWEQPKTAPIQNPILNLQKSILMMFEHTPNPAHAKKLYRELAIKYHPDKENGNAEIMKYINSIKDKFL